MQTEEFEVLLAVFKKLYDAQHVSENRTETLLLLARGLVVLFALMSAIKLCHLQLTYYLTNCFHCCATPTLCAFSVFLFIFFRLNNCQLQGDCCKALAVAVSTEFTQLKDLDLSANDFQEVHLKALCVGMCSQFCKLETLRSHQLER